MNYERRIFTKTLPLLEGSLKTFRASLQAAIEEAELEGYGDFEICVSVTGEWLEDGEEMTLVGVRRETDEEYQTRLRRSVAMKARQAEKARLRKALKEK